MFDFCFCVRVYIAHWIVLKLVYGILKLTFVKLNVQYKWLLCYKLNLLSMCGILWSDMTHVKSKQIKESEKRFCLADLLTSHEILRKKKLCVIPKIIQNLYTHTAEPYGRTKCIVFSDRGSYEIQDVSISLNWFD